MKPYFPALDSLRFFASLNIVLLHFSSSNLLSYTKGTPFDYIIKGPLFSTDVFFLLSGFIYAILFNNDDRIPKLKPFMKERFFRLYPLHITCVLLTFLCKYFFSDIFESGIDALKALALNASLLWTFYPEQKYMLNQPSWALSIFFLCYLLTPSCSRFLNKQSNKTIWFLFSGLWFITLALDLTLDEFPNYLRSINFFSGMLLAKLFLNKAIRLPEKNILNDFLILLIFGLMYVNVSFCKQINEGLEYHVFSPILYSFLLLVFANNKGFIVKLFSAKQIRDVGKSSFYVYLIHGLVIGVLHFYIFKIDHWKRNIFDNPIATLIIVVLLYGICTAYSKHKHKIRFKFGRVPE